MQQYLEEKKQFQVKKVTLSLLGIAVTSVVLVTLFNWNSIPDEHQHIRLVESVSNTLTVSGIGRIVPRNKVIISAPQDGHIQQLNIRPGNLVHSGQVILSIKNYKLEQDVERAKFDLEDLKSETKLKKSELLLKKFQIQSNLSQSVNSAKKLELEINANKKLVALRIISKIKFEQSHMSYEMAQMDVESKTQQLALFLQSYDDQLSALDARVSSKTKQVQYLKHQISALKVHSSIKGLVSEVSLSVGQVVSQGDVLVELIDPAQLIARIKVPQYSSEKLERGLKTIIKTPNGTLSGAVEYVDSVIRDGAVYVYLTLPKELPSWAKPEQAIEAKVTTNIKEDNLYITPPENFHNDDGWLFYSINDDGYAEKISVKYTMSSDNTLLLDNAMKLGDKIVVTPKRYASTEKFKVKSDS